MDKFLKKNQQCDIVLFTNLKIHDMCYTINKVTSLIAHQNKMLIVFFCFFLGCVPKQMNCTQNLDLHTLPFQSIKLMATASYLNAECDSLIFVRKKRVKGHDEI